VSDQTFLSAAERDAQDEQAYAAAGLMGGITPPLGMGGPSQEQAKTPKSIARYVLSQLNANYYGGGLQANGVFVGGGKDVDMFICIDYRSPDPTQCHRPFEVTDFLTKELYDIFAIWAKAYEISEYRLPEGAQF
jgi:hypothetical protein